MTKEDYYPKCTKFGKHHGAYFQEIKRMGTKYVGGEEVVRWCSECGAITIDFEEYTRRMKSTVPIKFPKSLNGILDERDQIKKNKQS